MRKLFLLSVSLLFCSPVYADNVETLQTVDASRNLGASDITAAILSAADAVWTGWISTDGLDDVTFVVTLVDANSTIASISMRCETASLYATADDAGANLCTRAISAGVETYTCPGTKILNDSPGSTSWQWTVTDVNAKWLNCLFTASAIITATVDTLTVTSLGVSP